MKKYIMGLSAYYHDSAAAIICNGEIVAAAQEERFTRKKQDSSFPLNSIQYCLKEANISLSELECVVFYEKPLLKFDRLLETYLAYAPKGIKSFLAALPVWLKEKLYLKNELRKGLAQAGMVKVNEVPKLLFSEHHQAHAASAFFPSPFDKAAVLCLDGVGEWETTTGWLGEGNQLTPLWKIDFPHSIGMLYSAFTYYLGFKVNSGEYKVMGLAPYGKPVYVDKIKKHLIDIHDDGSFKLNMDYFNFATGLTMTNKKFNALFGGPPRKSESEITIREMDIASSIQKVTEEIILKITKKISEETNMKNLCLAGGVALNCVANGKVVNQANFDKIWIQPAAGDSGGALGAALAAWYSHYQQPRSVVNDDVTLDSMKGAYLGPAFTNEEIEVYLKNNNAVYERMNEKQLMKEVASLMADEKVVGWFSGRMEFGPRALGARSIIGDARSSKMQSIMNLKIKYRESFRPFAPAVLYGECQKYFGLDQESPYMLLVTQVKNPLEIQEQDQSLTGFEKLKIKRSSIPAITHVDYSARIQTVHEETNPRFYKLIQAFEETTDCAVIINTSFNVRGEPIVCTPEDAYRCFMRTEMDVLVLEDCILFKKDQTKGDNNDSWKEEFALD